MVTSVSRSYSEPWRRKPQRESSGTGFLISWGEDTQQPIRIITNAHFVRNATTVRARASFGPHVVSCQVEWLSLPLDNWRGTLALSFRRRACALGLVDVASFGVDMLNQRSSRRPTRKLAPNKSEQDTRKPKRRRAMSGLTRMPIEEPTSMMKVL